MFHWSIPHKLLQLRWKYTTLYVGWHTDVWQRNDRHFADIYVWISLDFRVNFPGRKLLNLYSNFIDCVHQGVTDDKSGRRFKNAYALVNLGALNTLRPRQNGRHFANNIFQCIFLNVNVWTSNKFSLNFVARCPINNIPGLVQIMVWHRQDKPLSKPTMFRLLMHIYVTRPQWVKSSHLNKILIIQSMGKIFCVEFQRAHLKFHTKYLTHIYWLVWFLYNFENLRALRFTSS